MGWEGNEEKMEVHDANSHNSEKTRFLHRTDVKSILEKPTLMLVSHGKGLPKPHPHVATVPLPNTLNIIMISFTHSLVLLGLESRAPRDSEMSYP